MSRLPRVLAGTRRTLLATLVVNGFTQAAAALAAGHFVHAILQIIQHGTGTSSSTALCAAGAGLASSALLLAALRVREREDAERMGQHYVTELRLALFDALARTPLRAVQRRSRGVLVLRFIGDVRALRQWLSLGLARLTVAGIGTALVITTLALLDAPVALGATLVIAGGLVILHMLGSRTREAVREARRRQSQLAANVTERIATIGVVQAFDQSGREHRRLARQSERLAGALVAQARHAATLRSVAEFTAASTTGTALMIGAWQVMHGAATVAEVIAAGSVIAMLVPGLRDAGRAAGYLNAARVSRQRLERFLAEPRIANSASGAPDFVPDVGTIEFRNVSVEGSLRQFTEIAPARKRIAVVGPNAGGKSTLLATVARLVDPDRGHVLLDGQDIVSLEPGSVRRAVGIVSPDLPLLRGTIESNLRYRWPDAPDEALRQVMGLCGVDQAIVGMPGGLSARVSEGGANLSLGQRQRLLLARALLGNPIVLLLDEVDANLDSESATVIGRAIDAYPGTVLMVTHRVEQAARADVLWYVENGRLVDSGPPAVLLHRPGPAVRLFRARLRLAAGVGS